jgi:hypothetical protein
MPVAALAQEPRPIAPGLAAESVVSGGLYVEHDGVEGMSAFDLTGGWRLGDFEALARPVVRRDLEGDWHADIYQLAVRYARPGRVAWRLEAGYLPSPVGISPLESRADVNPMIAPIGAYTASLPAFEAGTPGVSLMSPWYPLAAQLTLSARRWDVRAAVLESSLVRTRSLTGGADESAGAQLALGGGITPVVGLRVGGSFARGRYARGADTSAIDDRDRQATLAGIDADWSFRYTRIYGDAVVAAFDKAAGVARASVWTVTAVQTLSPRWYVAARSQRQTTMDRLEQVDHSPSYGHGDDGGYSTPHAYEPSPAGSDWLNLGAGTALSVETTVGLRLSPELTLRAGYLGYRGFSDEGLEHHATASVVWSKRVR